LRENGCVAPITLISREPNLPIDRIKLSKALITDASKILLRPQEWYDEAGITTITDNVTSVDFENKSVSTESGKSYRYTKLILATGGTPKRLPLPGFKELSNIFVLRSVTDVKEIVAAVGDKGKKVVIVGSSFIGMEIANALAKENTVSVIGMETVPLERVLGSKIGASVQKMCEKTGVKFYLEAGVEKATPSTTSPNAVGAVHLKDGTAIEADLVILGVGISPATEYLQSSKAVTLEKDGSLKTNAAFEVVGLESVYAVGDIATYPYHGPGGNGAPTRIEHWNVAQNAGRRAGGSIARPAAPPKPFIPIFWSALGSQLRYCGNTVHGWDGLVVQGHLAEGRFAAFYAKGETIVAVATMGMDPVMAKAADLMLVGKMPGKAELEKGADLLAVAF
jgi:NADPH-dependent 2,4-dienoyl-CoA reductase/sulfur reductase-like enzyme